MTTLFAPPTKIQGSFPGATVTVFNAGTVNLATIYADTTGTPKPNPFTADQNSGMWFFYAANGHYDVQFSGAGIAVPFTLGDLELFDYSTLVLDVTTFGPVGTSADILIKAALAAAPATAGAIIDVRGLQGSQSIASQILITKPNITFLFGAATFTLSGVVPAQGNPVVGGVFQINANNVWFIGTAGATVMTLGGGNPGEQACAFFFVSNASVGFANTVIGGGLRNLELNGNKANITSQADDTFQCGVGIYISNAQSVDSAITVDNCLIHDFNHDGIVTYGYSGTPNTSSHASGNHFINNKIYSNGKNDGVGTGFGIFINQGSSRNFINNNTIYSNQYYGITCSAVSDGSGHASPQFNNQITNNIVYSNTLGGISAIEEDDFGSIAGSNQNGLIIANNQSFSNGTHGIVLSATATAAAILQNWVIANNIVYGNTQEGIFLNLGGGCIIQQGIITGNQAFNNSAFGIILQPGAKDNLVLGNIALNNPSGNISDFGTQNVLAGNKQSTANGIYVVPGPMTVAGNIQITSTAGITVHNPEALNVNQDGTRNWAITASGGLLNFASGDGAGAFNFSALGIQTGGPVTPAAVTYANRPGFGSLASLIPGAGMIIVIADSNTTTWGATIAGGGTNQVLAWYNSSTGNWTVIGH